MSKNKTSSNKNSELKKKAEAVFKKLGISGDEAINAFYENVIQQNKLPFEMAGKKENFTFVVMDESWQNWVKENLERGCSPIEIKGILEKDGFPDDEIKAAMGGIYPSVPSSSGKISDIDYKAICNVKATKIAKKFKTDLLQLYTLENFLTNEECDELIKLSNKSLRPSTVTGEVDTIDKYHRTSTTCDLSHFPDPIVGQIDKKIAETLGVQLPYSEGIQIQRYDVGQEFKPHTDYFTPNTKEYEKYASEMGNRTWTFMVYLNDVPKGGGTNFVKIKHTFLPKKGMAVIWNNLKSSGVPNPATVHWGQPVEEGFKIIITKWFREKGYGEMFYGK